ncbi:MAG: hypothetical protein KIS94_05610 [Chitinophagales bacterium]|nr:hypothetical protein [Chitinophagales bacterium]
MSYGPNQNSFSIVQPSGTFTSPSGSGDNTGWLGGFFSMLSTIGSSAFQFGSNYIANQSGQASPYGQPPVIVMQQPQQQQQQQPGLSTTAIVLIVLLIIIIMAVFAFMIYNSTKSAK